MQAPQEGVLLRRPHLEIKSGAEEVMRLWGEPAERQREGKVMVYKAVESIIEVHLDADGKVQQIVQTRR
jgi:hypothetical protein